MGWRRGDLRSFVDERLAGLLPLLAQQQRVASHQQARRHRSAEPAGPDPTNRRPNPGLPRLAHDGTAVDCQAIIRQPSSVLVQTLV